MASLGTSVTGARVSAISRGSRLIAFKKWVMSVKMGILVSRPQKLTRPSSEYLGGPHQHIFLANRACCIVNPAFLCFHLRLDCREISLTRLVIGSISWTYALLRTIV
jgi:hypothetical protein